LSARFLAKPLPPRSEEEWAQSRAEIYKAIKEPIEHREAEEA